MRLNAQEVGWVGKGIRANLGLIVLNLIILFVVSFAVTRTYALYENSLSIHPQWMATKTTLRRGVIGVMAFASGRQALARNQLNLGAWHGFQEVIYRDELNLSAIEFRFRVEDDGYVHVLYDYQAGGFSGVRLSSNPIFPNLSYNATADGEFTKFKELTLRPLIPNIWHQAKITFMDDSAVVTLDNLNVGVFKRLPGSQRIGFRGGQRDVWIDEVSLTDRDGQVRIERFANMRGQWQRLALVFAGMLVITIAALKLCTTSRRHIGMGTALAVSLFGCFVGGVYLLQYVRGSDYPITRNDNTRMEASWTSRMEILADIRARYSAKVPPNVFRILILGSSQTWGAGAKIDEDAWVRQLESRLNKSGYGLQVECINAGVSGFITEQVLKMLRTDLSQFEATAAVVNLSSNDIDVAKFQQDLDQLVRELRSRNIRTVLMLEPNSPERRPTDSSHGELESKHAIVRAVAASYGLPVIDLQAHLAERKNAGFLWWDFVHLTSFGQRLVADKLAIDLPRLLGMDQ